MKRALVRFNLSFRRLSVVVVSVALIGALLPAVVTGAPPQSGSLDPSFGSGGKVLTDFGGNQDIAYGVAIKGGQIVAAGVAFSSTDGDFALARYNADGSLNTLFGSGGKVTTDFSGSGSGDLAYALAILGSGKIVAAGYSGPVSSPYNYDFALARYNANGSLDPTFGSGGKVLTDFSGSGGFDKVRALAIQGDGKIVAAGDSCPSFSSCDVALARYKTDGSLDLTFGSGGTVRTDLGGTDDTASAVAIQGDGKIVTAGWATTSGSLDFALVRYTANGSLDTTFGSGGKVLTDFSGSGSYDAATALIVQSDGKIVAAGVSNARSTYDDDFALARYNPADGSLDSSFGTGGKVLTDFGGEDGALALAIQGNGKLVAAGFYARDTSEDFALARYSAGGALDTTLGGSGTVLTDFGGHDTADALAIQGNGKIVAAGVSDASGGPSANSNYDDFALARYNP